MRLSGLDRYCSIDQVKSIGLYAYTLYVYLEGNKLAYLRNLRSDDAGTSQAMGTALLTGVVVVAAATTGLFLLGGAGDESESANLNVEIEFEGSDVILSHEGGERVGAGELVVEAGENESVVNEAFVPGDEVRVAGLLSGTGQLRVVHVPANEVLIALPYAVADGTEDDDDDGESEPVADIELAVEDELSDDPVEDDALWTEESVYQMTVGANVTVDEATVTVESETANVVTVTDGWQVEVGTSDTFLAEDVVVTVTVGNVSDSLNATVTTP